ncbi:putative resistance to glucose repression protein 1 [Amylocarpus encephaloides]|uniref:Resistance to glucose repression protein 1 n=1 Tax=Amylocarpus encephaloides TaxID=45428 RepID=A0A9P7YH34_9HELO|nr:putative resistance to glucose repression protein 1 [Amylocarpus encephaloides]
MAGISNLKMEDDMRPQDEYFEWEDIISYKATPASRPAMSRRSANLSITHFQSDPYDSDARSEWSETESASVSVGGFSTATSISTHTSMSADDFEEAICDDEDHIDFLPSYDDDAARRRAQALSSKPLGALDSSQPSKPDLTERAEDDTAAFPTPSRHVDYLSHDWTEEDIWMTWKYLKSTRSTYKNNERLLNASWRMWMKERHQLAETEPTSINWMKDRDTTWLYGPLQPGAESTDALSASTSWISSAIKVKPILKKPGLSEVLLRRSISSAALVRQAEQAALEAQSISNPSRHASLPMQLLLEVRRSTVIGLGKSTSRRQNSALTKSVRFYDEVEQTAIVSPRSTIETIVESIFEVSSEEGGEDKEGSCEEPPKSLPVENQPKVNPLNLDPASQDSDEVAEGWQEYMDSPSSESDNSDDGSMEDYFGAFSSTGSSKESHVTASVLDPRRENLVDLVMEEFWALFNQEWDSSVNQRTDGSRRSSDESNTSPSTSTESSSETQTRRKRQRGDESEGLDGGNDRKTKSRQQPTPRAQEETLKFACPFRKHDPQSYNIYTNRVCALSHWQTIARVKEHIYRCHQKAPHCQRCWRPFKNQQRLDAHITVAASDICEVRPGTSPEGITADIERKLRSRKKSHPNQMDEDRWKEIYKLLFPGAEVPSPYFEPVQEEGPGSPDSRELSNYENYIRRELPRLVRSNIESVVRRETQPLEAALIGNLISIIQDCQDRVFRSYRETQGISHQISTPLPATMPPTEALWASDATEFREDLDFLDAAFQAPQTTSALATPSFQQLDGCIRPNTLIFSDSGYASELICNCQNHCSCAKPVLEAQVRDEIAVAAPDPVRPWMDSLSHPNWQNVGDADDEADWWMNV